MIRLGPSPTDLAAPWRDQAGSVLIEFSLVTPLLLVLALGTFEFGRALQHNHVVNKGVRDAARYLAHIDVTCPSGDTGSLDDPTALDVARNLALTGYAEGGTPILGYWTDPASITVAIRCIDNTADLFRGADRIPVIRVTATVPYADLGALSFLGFGSITFEAEHEQVHFGQ